jgi:nucleoside-diphosphate-sugar epimerase
MRVAILGATSHIALNLIFGLNHIGNLNLELFARDTSRVSKFLSCNHLSTNNLRIANISTFDATQGFYDAIINCIGFGTPEKIETAGRDILFISEKFDNIALEITARHSGCKYINFSSGAVFGKYRQQPVMPGEELRICIDELTVQDSYAIAKLASEAKHRASPELDIIDLRIFSFFSRFADLSSHYLVNEMLKAVITDKPFITTTNDIVRDFIDPSDLCTIILLCLKTDKLNLGMDVFSKAPLHKQELIDSFIKYYGMKIQYTMTAPHVSSTGRKDQYYSLNKRATKVLNYHPNHTSLEGVLKESRILLAERDIQAIQLQ